MVVSAAVVASSSVVARRVRTFGVSSALVSVVEAVAASAVVVGAASSVLDASVVELVVAVVSAADASVAEVAASVVARTVVLSVASSAATVGAVPSITKVPKRTEQVPTLNFRIENRLMRLLNNSFPIFPPDEMFYDKFLRKTLSLNNENIL
ncbi:hypothetical protein STRDD13_01516 [Streptococcus sp. DD13]|nr:hypothetical protein STRDD13_01516 [Streptococcus sp. DD13]